MSIKSIEIKNFKSIEYLKIDLKNLNTFIGKNGVGKSTISNAVRYFYDNLTKSCLRQDLFDKSNKYKTEIEITIEYDFTRIIRYVEGSYEMKLFGMRIKKHNVNNSVIVKMKQRKNEQIEWNIDYSERYIIENSHPVYFCDTRFLDLTNWDSLWNIVGDLINAKDANPILGEIGKTLESNQFNQFSQYLKIFEDFLFSNQLSISEDSKKNKVISLLQIQLGGKQFQNRNQSLDYYSDGTNSQNYILFLVYIAFEISRKRLKDATVVLDEPELGLHPKMIDEMMEKLIQYSEKIELLVFSHSPRIVASMLKNDGELYRISIENDYTKMNKLIKLKEEKTKLFLSDREASIFFSDFILFVEGVTEIEIFNNKVIQRLFPFLKHIEIVNTSSNDHVLRLLDPNNNTSEIPYLILVDSDKIINFKENKKKRTVSFSMRKLWYSPLMSRSVRDNLIKTISKKESRISLGLLNAINKDKKREYSYSGDFKLLKVFDPTFKNIRSFCLRHSLYPVRSTVEGSIVSYKSQKYFKMWLSKKNSSDELKKIIKNLSKGETNVLFRFLLEGKNDILEGFESKNYKERFSKFVIENNFKKNTGWITEFFEFYQKTVFNQKQYRKDKGNTKKIERFKKDFPELYDIIHHIEKRLNIE